MARFEVHSFELNSKKVVDGQGIVEAMLDYLPWPTVNVNVQWNPSSGVYNVMDNQTDFKYEVRLL